MTGLVWAIAIMCVSPSCEPLPMLGGWYDSQPECLTNARAIMEAWSPSIGFYEVSCIARMVI